MPGAKNRRERERKKKGKKFVEGIVNRTSNARRAQVRGSRRAWNWSSDISRVSQGAANFSRIPLSSWRGATSINASRTRVAFRKLDAYPRRARVESPRGRGRALARRRDHGERGGGVPRRVEERKESELEVKMPWPAWQRGGWQERGSKVGGGGGGETRGRHGGGRRRRKRRKEREVWRRRP